MGVCGLRVKGRLQSSRISGAKALRETNFDILPMLTSLVLA